MLRWSPTRALDFTLKGEEITTEAVDTVTSAVRAQAVMLRADYALRRNVVLSALGSYENDKFVGQDRQDNVYSTMLTVQYLLNRFSSVDQKKSPVIKQVLNYINLHYQDELSLKMLGSMFNVNSTYLCQLFQKETGYLFSDYVNRFKIEKARQMLLNTNLRAIEISKKSGFSDPNYFFKQFKKYVGVSPRELRNFKKSE